MANTLKRTGTITVSKHSNSFTLYEGKDKPVKSDGLEFPVFRSPEGVLYIGKRDPHTGIMAYVSMKSIELFKTETSQYPLNEEVNSIVVDEIFSGDEVPFVLLSDEEKEESIRKVLNLMSMSTLLHAVQN